MLMGMLTWIVSIGRFDVAFAVSSMARFTACPRKGHLQRALRIFGFLKARRNRRICVDSREPVFSGAEEALEPTQFEGLHEEYPDATEEIDHDLPEPLIDEIMLTIMVDLDHAHNKVTRRSITGILAFLGRTPVFW